MKIKFLFVTGLFLVVCLGFTRCRTNSVKDIDGNVYPTVTIGTQVWMAADLRTTRYSTGDKIATTTPCTLVIETENKPAYHWAYNGDEKNVASYGRLYTWYVATDSRNVCPAGWHVPSDEEWTVLTDFLIGKGFGYGVGYKGKDIAKSLAAPHSWVAAEESGSPGYDQTKNNKTGFTAIATGCRLEDGKFHEFGHVGNWWTSSESGKGFGQILTGALVHLPGGVIRTIYHDYFYVNSYVNNKKYGMAIRCLKDK